MLVLECKVFLRVFRVFDQVKGIALYHVLGNKSDLKVKSWIFKKVNI
jgi:hypothetical protein